MMPVPSQAAVLFTFIELLPSGSETEMVCAFEVTDPHPSVDCALRTTVVFWVRGSKDKVVVFPASIVSGKLLPSVLTIH